jgi:type IV secretion system protein VirB5
MRRLFASVALVACVTSTTARADLPVIDVASIAQLAKTLGIETQQLTTQLNQLKTLITTYNQLVQTYNQTVAIWNSLSHLTNINQVAALLNNPLLRNPLPSTSSLPGTITGINAPSTLGGSWSGAAQTYLQNNTVYLPKGQDWQSQQLQKNANYLSTIEGLAQQNSVALEQRQAALAQIQAQISSASDVKAIADVQARIAAEQAYVNGQQAQAQNLVVLTTAQAAAMQQQEIQRGRWEQDQAKADVCASFGLTGAVCQ